MSSLGWGRGICRQVPRGSLIIGNIAFDYIDLQSVIELTADKIDVMSTLVICVYCYLKTLYKFEWEQYIIVW